MSSISESLDDREPEIEPPVPDKEPEIHSEPIPDEPNPFVKEQRITIPIGLNGTGEGRFERIDGRILYFVVKLERTMGGHLVISPSGILDWNIVDKKDCKSLQIIAPVLDTQEPDGRYTETKRDVYINDELIVQIAHVGANINAEVIVRWIDA